MKNSILLKNIKLTLFTIALLQLSLVKSQESFAPTSASGSGSASSDPAISKSSLPYVVPEIPEGYPKNIGETKKCSDDDRKKENIKEVLYRIYQPICGTRSPSECSEASGISCSQQFYNYYEPCLYKEIESYTVGECKFEIYDCTQADRDAGCTNVSFDYNKQVCGIRSNDPKCKDNDKKFGCRDNFPSKACACGKSDIAKVQLTQCPWESMYNPYEWACSPEEKQNKEPCSADENGQGEICAYFTECREGECYKQFKNRCEACKHELVNYFNAGKCWDLSYYSCSKHDIENWKCDDIPTPGPRIIKYNEPIISSYTKEGIAPPELAVKTATLAFDEKKAYYDNSNNYTYETNPITGVCGTANFPESKNIGYPYKTQKFVNICRACKMPNLAWMNLGDCPPEPPRFVNCKEFIKTAKCDDPKSEESQRKMNTCGYKTNNFDYSNDSRCYGNDCMKSFNSLCEACSNPRIATAEENQCYFYNNIWYRATCKELQQLENQKNEGLKYIYETKKAAVSNDISTINASFATSAKAGSVNGAADASLSVNNSTSKIASLVKTSDEGINNSDEIKLSCDPEFDRKVCGLRKDCDEKKEYCWETVNSKCDACNNNNKKYTSIVEGECPKVETCTADDKKSDVCPMIWEGVCGLRDLKTCQGSACGTDMGSKCQACKQEGVEKVLRSSCGVFYPQFIDYTYLITQEGDVEKFFSSNYKTAYSQSDASIASPPVNDTAGNNESASSTDLNIYLCTDKDRDAKDCGEKIEHGNGVCGYKKSGCTENCYLTSSNRCLACSNSKNPVHYVVPGSCEQIIALRINNSSNNKVQTLNDGSNQSKAAFTQNTSTNTTNPNFESDDQIKELTSYRCTEADRKASCGNDVSPVCSYQTCNSGICPFTSTSKCKACLDSKTQYVVEQECKYIGTKRIIQTCLTNERNAVCSGKTKITVCGKFSISSKFCGKSSCTKNFENQCSACADSDVESFTQGDCDEKTYINSLGLDFNVESNNSSHNLMSTLVKGLIVLVAAILME